MNRILSGIQPTGNPTLGNYLGALKNWVKMQDTHECYFMLADLHALTVPQDPQKLRQSVRETAATLVACGIDIKKSTIFSQSAVPAHSELCWILSTFTPLGWLNRMTQFKDKARNSSFLEKNEQDLVDFVGSIPQESRAEDHKLYFKQVEENAALKKLKSRIKELESQNKLLESSKLGLYAYPILMAADILIYRATHVPTGEDQKQHLELARDIAGAFNRHYGTEFFPLPEPVITGEATRVMSLRDGTKKMSKSDESDYSRINLTDDADTIAAKFRKAKTDVEPLPDTIEVLEKRPEADNLVTLYAALSDRTRKDVLAEFAGAQFSKFKPALADLAIAKVGPITAKMRELMADKAEIDKILIRGAEHANALTGKHMREIKDIVGLWSVM